MPKFRQKVFLILLGLCTAIIFAGIVLVVHFSHLQFEQAMTETLLSLGGNTTLLEDDPHDELASLPQQEGKAQDTFVIRMSDSGQPQAIFASDANRQDTERLFAKTIRILNSTRPGSINIPAPSNNAYCWYYVNPSAIVMIYPYEFAQHLVMRETMVVVCGCLLEVVGYFLCKKIAAHISEPVERSLEAQQHFVADASHELKTPVAVIRANCEAMADNPQPRWLDNIMEETDRMSDLIRELLDLTKSEQAPLNKTHLNLSRVVEKQCLVIEAAMFEKNLQFEDWIEPDIYILADEGQLKQLTAILIDNAIKHSTGVVMVTLTRKGREAMLTVSNTGEPIPLEEQARIFERFYRADPSHNRNASRYGLGLAIARSIVDRHGGRIGVHCANGQTSFFAVFKTITG